MRAYMREREDTIAKINGFENLAGGGSNCSREIEQCNICSRTTLGGISGHDAPERGDRSNCKSNAFCREHLCGNMKNEELIKDEE
jgi:hypothetical protein